MSPANNCWIKAVFTLSLGKCVFLTNDPCRYCLKEDRKKLNDKVSVDTHSFLLKVHPA